MYKYNYIMYIQNLKNLFLNLFLQKVSGIKEKCKKVMLKVGFLLIIKRFFQIFFCLINLEMLGMKFQKQFFGKLVRLCLGYLDGMLVVKKL